MDLEPWHRCAPPRAARGHRGRARWLGAALVGLAVLTLVQHQGRPTLRVAAHLDPRDRPTPPPAYLRQGPAPDPAAPDPGPAAPGTDPPPSPDRHAPPRPDPGPARPAAPPVTQALAEPPLTGTQDPGVLIARFQRHFAAGDLTAILRLLADDARIGRLGDHQAGIDDADFFAATLRRAYRLAPLRLRPDGRGRYLAEGDLHGPGGRAAGQRAGRLRLELTRTTAGYRVSALRYQLGPAPAGSGD